MKNKNTFIRYWALKGLSTDKMSKYLLEQDATSDLVQNLVAGLMGVLEEETNSLVISQIATAAALPKFAKALEVIENCLEKRWALYNQWRVSDELIDSAIIHTTLEMVGRGDLAENTALQNTLLYSAGKLFSAGVQRYQLGMRYKDKEDNAIILLETESQHKLQSLLIESERAFRKACSRVDPSTSANPRLLSAIQSQNWTGIDEAYQNLIGSDGEVDRVFSLYTGDRKFPYPPIATPSESIIEQAKIRQYVAENTYKPSE